MGQYDGAVSRLAAGAFAQGRSAVGPALRWSGGVRLARWSAYNATESGLRRAKATRRCPRCPVRDIALSPSAAVSRPMNIASARPQLPQLHSVPGSIPFYLSHRLQHAVLDLLPSVSLSFCASLEFARKRSSCFAQPQFAGIRDGDRVGDGQGLRCAGAEERSPPPALLPSLRLLVMSCPRSVTAHGTPLDTPLGVSAPRLAHGHGRTDARAD